MIFNNSFYFCKYILFENKKKKVPHENPRLRNYTPKWFTLPNDKHGTDRTAMRLRLNTHVLRALCRIY